MGGKTNYMGVRLESFLQNVQESVREPEHTLPASMETQIHSYPSTCSCGRTVSYTHLTLPTICSV